MPQLHRKGGGDEDEEESPVPTQQSTSATRIGADGADRT